MQVLLLGVLLLVVILLAGRAYVNADAKVLARLMKRVGGVVVLVAAIGLLLTGKVFVALPMAAFAFWLLGRRFPFFPFPGNGADDVWKDGQRSRVRTAMLEMTLDHSTGATDGSVLSGRFAGRQLSGLSRDELFALLQDCTLRDPQGAQLLRAFMERIGIRPEQARAGGGGRGPGATGMTVDEAYDVLGLTPGASEDEIHAAHRALMKKNHPDQGGSTYLAAKINEAKDVLLRQ
jgi:DnaJ domain